jgi:hypothetical protein
MMIGKLAWFAFVAAVFTFFGNATWFIVEETMKPYTSLQGAIFMWALLVIVWSVIIGITSEAWKK